MTLPNNRSTVGGNKAGFGPFPIKMLGNAKGVERHTSNTLHLVIIPDKFSVISYLGLDKADHLLLHAISVLRKSFEHY
jgi:hypothetical protein